MNLTNKLLTIGVMTAVLAIGGIVQATPIYIGTAGADFNTLLGGLAAPAGSALPTNFSGGNLSAEVISQAFTDGLGNYLYLYQLKNTGVVGNDVITRFTASPYAQADNTISLGYLTANIPAAFLLGDQAPLYGDVDAAAGPTVGFNFPVGNPIYGIPDSYIAPTKMSKVLYVQSTLAPGLVTGNVINGGVHSGPIIGPVPEPATVTLLVMAGLGLLCYARRRRRS